MRHARLILHSAIGFVVVVAIASCLFALDPQTWSLPEPEQVAK